jgi:predicted nucleic acid-binding Zn ribbon protein
MIKVNWTDGECSECGDRMKVVATMNFDDVCKACQHIKVLERIAYVLEQHIGWS